MEGNASALIQVMGGQCSPCALLCCHLAVCTGLDFLLAAAERNISKKEMIPAHPHLLLYSQKHAPSWSAPLAYQDLQLGATQGHWHTCKSGLLRTPTCPLQGGPWHSDQGNKAGRLLSKLTLRRQSIAGAWVMASCLG